MNLLPAPQVWYDGADFERYYLLWEKIMGLMALRGASIEQILYTLFALLIVVVTSLPIHEFAHGWVAHKLGDDTAYHAGRLNLNPLRHLDPMGTLLLLLAGFGWAKPVPVNPNNFTRKISLRAGMAITAAAGPIANLLMAFVVYTGYKLCLLVLIAMDINYVAQIAIFLQILSMMVSVNISLAVFNMLPVPPLDGSRIFGFLFPKLDNLFARYQQVLYPILFGLVLFTPILDVPIAFVRDLLLRGLEFATGWIDLIARLL